MYGLPNSAISDDLGDHSVLLTFMVPANHGYPGKHTHTPVLRPSGLVRDNPGELALEARTNLDFTEARDSE